MKEQYQAYLCGWICEQTHLKAQYSLDVVIPKHFPDVLPDVYISDRSVDLFLKNPHVSKCGKICIAPESSSIDTSEPVELIRYAVESADSILVGKETGDFIEEFRSYWGLAIEKGTRTFLLIDDIDCMDDVAISVIFDRYILVGISLESIKKWWAAYRPKTPLKITARKCLMVRLTTPLFPVEYPESVPDLINLLRKKAPIHAERLESHFCNSHEFISILFVQHTDNGPTLAGVFTKGSELARLKKCFNGFRPGKAPKALVLQRGKKELIKGIFETPCVQRVDHSWIHTRGGNGHNYSDKRIILLGCGSLGGYVAHLLTRAGIGFITLVDKDSFEWNNIGRHLLGADDVGQKKAEALSAHLQMEMPHIAISAIPKDWRDWVHERKNVLSSADLIVSTMAQWNSERLLNKMAKQLSLPPLLFAWLEPYAVAGHVLSVRKEGGCLACGINRFGYFSRNVAEFPEATISKEPGGCTRYQRYGPVDLWPVASMTVDAVLLHLGKGVNRSTLHTLAQSEKKIFEYGATISKGWNHLPLKETGQQIYYQEWAKDEGCTECN